MEYLFTCHSGRIIILILQQRKLKLRVEVTFLRSQHWWCESSFIHPGLTYSALELFILSCFVLFFHKAVFLSCMILISYDCLCEDPFLPWSVELSISSSGGRTARLLEGLLATM